MATTTLNRTGRRWYVGAQGNLSISPTHAVTLDAAINDVIVFGDAVEKNIKIVGLLIGTDALGASSALTVKVGDTTLVSAKATAAAVNEQILIDDHLTAEGDTLSLTVTGGAAAGDVKIRLLYEVLGNL